MFLRDYGVDGLRFDAVQAIDPSAVSEIVWSLRNDFPSKYLIAEYNPNDSGTSVAPWHDPYGSLGFCATWNMDSPWRMYDILNGINVVDIPLRADRRLFRSQSVAFGQLPDRFARPDLQRPH